MLGMFLPWKARTLLVCGLRADALSMEGGCLCRCSCCWSFVVVILVRSPATISIMCSTFIALISYCGPWSAMPRERDLLLLRISEKALISSVAKLWMCCKSRTLIFLGLDDEVSVG